MANKAGGSLTLTVRPGETIIIDVPDGEPVLIYVAKADSERVSLNLRAPRSYRITRVHGYDRLSHISDD